MIGDRRKGFEVAPNQALTITRAKDGRWSAWLEDEQQPASPCDETVKVFVGDSAFQAQIKAIRWLRQSQPQDGPTSTVDQPQE
jgi:hypothetical protein